MGNWKEHKKAKKETNKAMGNGELKLFFYHGWRKFYL
jgi:hypothetical protein